MICDFFITFRRSKICISFRLKIYVFPFLPFCYCLQWQFRFSIFPVHLKSAQLLMFLELIFILLLTIDDIRNHRKYDRALQLDYTSKISRGLYKQAQQQLLEDMAFSDELLCQCLKGSLPKRPLLCPHGGETNSRLSFLPCMKPDGMQLFCIFIS